MDPTKLLKQFKTILRPGIRELAKLCTNLLTAIHLWRSRPNEVIDAGVIHLNSNLMCLEGVFPCIPMVSINVILGT